MERTVPANAAASPPPRPAVPPPAAGNLLLAAFPEEARIRLAPDMEEVPLGRGQVLFEPGHTPSHAHFPHAGTMVALVLPLRDGGATATVTLGLEGAAGLGVDPTDMEVAAFVRGVVQMPGPAARVPTARLAEAAVASPALRRLLARHGELLVAMALQSAACNARHPLRARLAGWLLTALDRAPPSPPGGGTWLPLTQEFLAEMLGVRRATVGEAALAFQAAGLLKLRRGGLLVLDRAGLEGVSCECPAALRRRRAQLLPMPADADAAADAAAARDPGEA